MKIIRIIVERKTNFGICHNEELRLKVIYKIRDNYIFQEILIPPHRVMLLKSKYTENDTLTNPSATLKVPTISWMIPNIYIIHNTEIIF